MNNEKIKEILKKAKVDAFFMNFLPAEKVNIEISADIETACWSFIPPHRIVVGNEKHHSKRSENYIQSLLWHELSHAKWTERDFKKINTELNKRGIPFKLYNLFEDARIEQCFREETGKKFNWLKDLPNKATFTPVELFYSFINNEGVYQKEGINSFDKIIELRLLYVDRGRKTSAAFSINNEGEYHISKVAALLNGSGYSLGNVLYKPKASAAKSKVLEQSWIKSNAKKAHGTVKITLPDSRCIDLVSYISNESESDNVKTALSISLTDHTSAAFDKVADFYKRACEARNSMEIVHICEEWLKEFRDTRNASSVSNYQDRKGKDIFSPEDMQNISGDNISGDEQSLEEASIPDLTRGSTQGLGRILKGIPETFNETRLNKLTQLFKGIIKRGMVKYNSTIPFKKVNIRNYSLGSDKIFKKQQYENGKSERLSVILDCSGSMNGEHLYAGKEFLIIINRLAKQGLIKGNIILTESNEQILLSMPADENIIKSITTGGGEGFKRCIEKYGRLLQESVKVFIFTDGAIGDIPDGDYNRKLGIKTYGLYVGESDQTEQLREFFNEAISKTSLEDVINELLKIIK